jgi:hypothetical protein
MQSTAPVSLVKICKLNKKYISQTQDTSPEQQYDMVVARDDGRLEIYTYQINNPFPTLCFETQIKSTITSIDAGHITMTNSKDIILSCYDGKILVLVDSKKFKKQGIMASENAPTLEENPNAEKEKNKKISDMEREVQSLEKQV